LSNSVVPISEQASLPAHLQTFLRDGALGNEDLSSGVGSGFAHISYKGKVWHVVQGEDRTLVTNDDGDPRASIEVVILKANAKISKTFYATGFEEGTNAKPDCYSNDGVAPAVDAQSPQAAKCAICPHNQWGSKITEQGAKGKACGDVRRLAVAPSGDLENAMLLRVPAASLKELAKYAELLGRRKVPYQAAVTKIGFDHDVAFPKLTFQAVRWLDPHEVPVVAEMMDSDIVQQIIATSVSVAALPPPDENDGLPPGAPPAMTSAPAAGPGADPAKVNAVLDGIFAKPATETAPAATPAPAAAKPVAAKAKKPAMAQAAPAATPAPAPVVAAAAPSRDAALVLEADAELDDILGHLDD
jgi:hypothetical protein